MIYLIFYEQLCRAFSKFYYVWNNLLIAQSIRLAVARPVYLYEGYSNFFHFSGRAVNLEGLYLYS